nr:aldehyde dehydrogenase family protein [Nocardioides ginsengisegetis]
MTEETTSSPAAVVGALRRVFASGQTRDHAWRDAQLAGLGRLLSERGDDLVAALAADLRRTEFESIMFDLVSITPEIKHARNKLKRWMMPRRVSVPLNVKPGKAWYTYEPLGVVMVIGAWNYPVNLTFMPLIAALAAGNCVVVKPSEVASHTSAALAELLPLYVDPEAVVVVEGGAEVTLDLIDQNLDHVFFTGSPTVGSAIMAAASKHLTPVTLELGGKCPVIVTESARLDVAARRIAFGKLANSGQTCVAPDYVMVDRKVRDEFVPLLVKTLEEFSEGRRLPIVNQRHAARIEALVASAGGQVVTGGDVDVENASAPITVVLDPAPGSAIMAEEIFGPVLPVVTVEGLDDAIGRVNAGTKPLASYLFTQDRSDEERSLAGFSAGATVINHVMMHMAVHDLPFGGVGTSGTGRYHGHWGFETFSHAKAILRQQTRIDPRLMYPPYSPRFQKMVRKQL